MFCVFFWGFSFVLYVKFEAINQNSLHNARCTKKRKKRLVKYTSYQSLSISLRHFDQMIFVVTKSIQKQNEFVGMFPTFDYIYKYWLLRTDNETHECWTELIFDESPFLVLASDLSFYRRQFIAVQLYQNLWFYAFHWLKTLVMKQNTAIKARFIESISNKIIETNAK